MKTDSLVFMDFSGLYEGILDYCKKEYPAIPGIRYDLSALSGTSYYVDEEACGIIREIIGELPERIISFNDSGNYHYMSLFFLERIETGFSLVLFDNHPDFQESAFGEVLSCGSWVKFALNLPNLKKVYLTGVSGEHLKEAGPLPEKVELCRDVSAIEEDNIYISIDKDVLAPGFAACDWDQGTMTLEGLTKNLKALLSHNVIGADICGEKRTAPKDTELFKNFETNRVLLSLFLGGGSTLS